MSSSGESKSLASCDNPHLLANKAPGSFSYLGDDKPGRPSSSGEGAWESFTNIAAVVLPRWTGICIKSCLALTVTLYILNQKHLLPKTLSAVVSKTLFWPTLPITISKRLGKWSTVVDDTVLLGGAPFGFANYPDRLYHDYGVRGVINLCEEYQGPDHQYFRLGMKHLRLPTVDHFEPTVADLERAVSFIQQHQKRGERVYVHCRAGHGRSAAVVFAWLLYKDPDVDLQDLNEEFCQIRNVRKTLWKQKNINDFHERLLRRSNNDDGDYHSGGGSNPADMARSTTTASSETEDSEHENEWENDESDL